MKSRDTIRHEDVGMKSVRIFKDCYHVRTDQLKIGHEQFITRVT